MVEAWLLEFVKGIGKLFLNPLFYWTFILVFLAGYLRVKKERNQFGVKIFNIYTEWKGTWLPAIFVGLILSIAILASGLVLSSTTLLTLSGVIILLSLSMRFSLLSASYTIGLTYLILLFAPRLLENQNSINTTAISEIDFVVLTILLGILLLVEAYFIARMKRNESFPNLSLSDRGVWIGHHQMKKLSVIPIFFLIPGGLIEPFVSFWPLLSIGENTYGLVLFPFLLGFDFISRGNLAQTASKQISKQILILGLIVLFIAFGSIYIPVLSFFAIIIALIGRELITYRYRLKDKRQNPYFEPQHIGIKILGIIPGTPADKLELQIGEVITKVNDKEINNPEEFYEALRLAGASFKLNVLDDQKEVRFVKSAFYEDDDYRLGLIFAREPYRNKN